MAQRGYGHRKLYPYATAKQKKNATKMVGFIKRNEKELEKQGNQTLSAPGEMEKKDATGALKSSWGRTQSKGTNGRSVSNYVDKNGGSRGRAKKILTSLHNVSFGADPKNK